MTEDPPEDERCVLFLVPDGGPLWQRCLNEGTHWEPWPEYGCGSWECDGPCIFEDEAEHGEC